MLKSKATTNSQNLFNILNNLIPENDEKLTKRFNENIQKNLNVNKKTIRKYKESEFIVKIKNDLKESENKYSEIFHTEYYKTKRPHRIEVTNKYFHIGRYRPMIELPTLNFPNHIIIYTNDKIIPDKITKQLKGPNHPLAKPIADYPVIPNYVVVESKTTEPSLANDESKEFALSLLYTDLLVHKATCMRQRSFSGNSSWNYFGKHKHHTFYFGNFGYCDGIHAEININSNKPEKKNADITISRESFLALSHMFNLKKLMGSDGTKTVVAGAHNHKLTMLLNRRDTTSESLSSSTKSTSVESVDFNLIQKFTERVNEPKTFSFHYEGGRSSKMRTVFGSNLQMSLKENKQLITNVIDRKSVKSIHQLKVV